MSILNTVAGMIGIYQRRQKRVTLPGTGRTDCKGVTEGIRDLDHAQNIIRSQAVQIADARQDAQAADYLRGRHLMIARRWRAGCLCAAVAAAAGWLAAVVL